MTPQLWTVAFLILWVLSIILWDALAFGLYGDAATVTNSLRRLGRAWPVFPYLLAFSFGLLIHHLFLDSPR